MDVGLRTGEFATTAVAAANALSIGFILFLHLLVGWKIWKIKIEAFKIEI